MQPIQHIKHSFLSLSVSVRVLVSVCVCACGEPQPSNPDGCLLGGDERTGEKRLLTPNICLCCRAEMPLSDELQ